MNITGDVGQKVKISMTIGKGANQALSHSVPELAVHGTVAHPLHSNTAASDRQRPAAAGPTDTVLPQYYRSTTAVLP